GRLKRVVVIVTRIWHRQCDSFNGLYSFDSRQWRGLFSAGTMNARSFSALLGPAAWAVLVGGWVLATAAFLAIGTESCTTVAVPVAGTIDACQDTTASAVIMLTVIG